MKLAKWVGRGLEIHLCVPTFCQISKLFSLFEPLRRHILHRYGTLFLLDGEAPAQLST